jgi:DNA-binding GntR family transcriptional regulator
MEILRGAIYSPNPRWSSNELAQALGVSQSAIARCWARVYAEQPILESFPQSIELREVHIAKGKCVIIARRIGDQVVGQESLICQMRSPRRIPMQTLLAGVLVESRNNTHAHTDLEDLLVSIDDESVLLTNLDVPSSSSVFVTNKWQGLLAYLVSCAHPTSAGALADLQQDLVSWASSGTAYFKWRNERTILKSSTSSASSKSKLRSAQQSLAEEAFEQIVSDIWAGRIGGGERISESTLARKLRTTRGQTREALRALAANRLIDFHPIRGVLVPSPTRTDITDLYTAKRALGAEILRRLIETKSLDLEPISAALAGVVACGQSGNSYDTGNADLAFQDVLADATGMRNVPILFQDLNRQLRIYIAVLGLTYVFSIDHMLRDDREIFHSLQTRNLDAALAAWERKIAESASYMSVQASKRRG